MTFFPEDAGSVGMAGDYAAAAGRRRFARRLLIGSAAAAASGWTVSRARLQEAVIRLRVMLALAAGWGRAVAVRLEGRQARWTLAALALVPLSLSAALVHRVYFDRGDLPSSDGFVRFEHPTTGEIVDARGEVLLELAREYRRMVTYDEVPVWLSWRRGNGYTGWVPLPPRATWRTRIGLSLGGLELDAFIGSSDYTFVHDRSFVDRGIYQRALPPTRNVTIIHVTRNVTNYAAVGERVVDRGIALASVERSVGRRVARQRTIELDRHDDPRAAAAGEVAVFRPHVRAAPGRRPSQGRSLVRGEAPSPLLLERRREREQERQRRGNVAEASAQDAERQCPVARPRDAHPAARPPMPRLERRQRQAEEQRQRPQARQEAEKPQTPDRSQPRLERQQRQAEEQRQRPRARQPAQKPPDQDQQRARRDKREADAQEAQRDKDARQQVPAPDKADKRGKRKPRPPV